MTPDTWPDWANYRATDANGAVYFFVSKPECGQTCWLGHGDHEPDTTVVPNWRESLEERPS